MACLRTIRAKRLARILLTSLASAILLLFATQPSARGQAAPARAIILPPKTVAGAPATLAVLDAAGRLVPSVAVELSGGQKVKTDTTGRAYFIVPAVPGALTAEIPGTEIKATVPIVGPTSPPAAGPAASPAQGLRIVSSPRFFSIQDRFAIEGAGFRGQADENHVFLADQPCLVLAASPVSLVVLPGPRTPVGAVGLRVSVGREQAGPNPASAISVEIIGPPEALRVGARTKLTIRVRGATERLVLVVRNATPEIVELSRGNLQRVETSGGARNAAEVKLRCVAPGNYAVTARLIQIASGSPDLMAARRKLVAARAAATGKWEARLDRVIERIDQHPEDTGRIRAALDRMLKEKPPDQLALLLESTWEELYKNN